MKAILSTLNVLVTMGISEPQLTRLKSRVRVTRAGWGLSGYRLGESELCGQIESADVLLVGYEKVTRLVLNAAARLQLIGVARANPVNLDIHAVNARKIPILYTPGRNAIAAAEFTLGLMLSQARHISEGDRLLRKGKYLGASRQDLFAENKEEDIIWNIDGENPYTSLRGVELCGRTLGLIGFGNVASQVARLAAAFGMRVISYAPHRDEEKARKFDVQIVPFEVLLAESDFISIHCSVNSDTRAIVDARAFSLMKPGAYLINTARASIVDQKALVDALEHRKIGGAALDVFWYEPLPVNHPLLRLENVTLTPHLAGSAHEVRDRQSRMLVDDLFAWMDGLDPINLYNREALQLPLAIPAQR